MAGLADGDRGIASITLLEPAERILKEFWLAEQIKTFPLRRRANGWDIEIVESFPFVLSRSKHANYIFQQSVDLEALNDYAILIVRERLNALNVEFRFLLLSRVL